LRHIGTILNCPRQNIVTWPLLVIPNHFPSNMPKNNFLVTPLKSNEKNIPNIPGLHYVPPKNHKKQHPIPTNPRMKPFLPMVPGFLRTEIVTLSLPIVSRYTASNKKAKMAKIDLFDQFWPNWKVSPFGPSNPQKWRKKGK